ncbi:type II toxin-antitoxin system RelB/ParD family antitoxin, partial [Streptococcus agalactiae]
LQNVVVTNEVDLLTEEELEKEKLFKQFQAEISKNIEDVRQGKFYTSEEVRAELEL